jgi:hypothetical protein
VRDRHGIGADTALDPPRGRYQRQAAHTMKITISGWSIKCSLRVSRRPAPLRTSMGACPYGPTSLSAASMRTRARGRGSGACDRQDRRVGGAYQVRGDARTGGTSTPRGLGRCPPRSWLRWDPCSREAGRGCRHVRRELLRPVTGAVRVSIPGPAATCGRAVRARVRCALRDGRLSSFWRGGVALTSGYELRSIGTRSRSRRGRRRLGGRGVVRGLRHPDRPGLRPGAVSTVGVSRVYRLAAASAFTTPSP